MIALEADRYNIEPEAQQLPSNAPAEIILLLSIALSTKRIADKLDAMGINDPETMAWTMGRAFEAGRRTDR